MPRRKVGSGLLAGSIVSILAWIAAANGIVIPAEAAAGLTTMITFIVSYFVPED